MRRGAPSCASSKVTAEEVLRPGSLKTAPSSLVGVGLASCERLKGAGCAPDGNSISCSSGGGGASPRISATSSSSSSSALPLWLAAPGTRLASGMAVAITATPCCAWACCWAIMLGCCAGACAVWACGCATMPGAIMLDCTIIGWPLTIATCIGAPPICIGAPPTPPPYIVTPLAPTMTWPPSWPPIW